jgi:hypothetical protein
MSQQTAPIDHAWVTTAFDIQGARIVRNLGIVRGITVRSRSVVGSIGAAFQQLGGGNITLYTELAEHALRRNRDKPGCHRGHLLWDRGRLRGCRVEDTRT